MEFFICLRAIFVRLLFASHGLVSVWHLYHVTKNPMYWYITTALVGLCVETGITLYRKKGQEWRRVCPSVTCYLLCMVPTIWFLELHELDERIKMKNNTYIDRSPAASNVASPSPSSSSSPASSSYPISSSSASVSNQDNEEVLETIWLTIKIPKVKPDEWVKTLEQLLLLLLIVGRWMLPKGKLTHNQLSQLLLVYIGTAGDIVEFFESFKEEQVRYNRPLCIVILSIWSWSLIQFMIVITASRARRDKTGLVPSRVSESDLQGGTTGLVPTPATSGLFQGSTPTSRRNNPCCTPDFYGILISISMQDGPYLILRLVLIFKYDCLSYTNIFFTCKNSLVCLLLLYRLVVIQIDRLRPPSVRYRFSDLGQVVRVTQTTSKTRLLGKRHVTPSTSCEYYNYKTKVNLVEWNDDDAAETRDVDYVIKRHFSESNGGVVNVEAETALNGCNEGRSDREEDVSGHPEDVGEGHSEELDRDGGHSIDRVDRDGGHSNEAWLDESLEEEVEGMKERELEYEEQEEEDEEEEEEREDLEEEEEEEQEEQEEEEEEDWEEEKKDVHEREEEIEVIII